MTRPLLTSEEIAATFHVTPRTIQRWARDRRIPHVRVGRRILFTQEQAEEIRAAYAIAPLEPDPAAVIPNPGFRPTAVVVQIDERHRPNPAA